MKNSILILLLIFGLFACDDDETRLDVSIPEDSIWFTPVNGGAVMHYNIPGPTDIYAVRARYTDAQGKMMEVSSSVFVDTLSLLGFNEARENVPVEIVFTNKNNVESEPIHRTFSTLVSGPYAFLDNVEIEEAWNGVYLRSNYTGEVTGLVNVYYVGLNAYTQKMDTLFADHMTITSGESEQFFEINFDDEENTVIVEAEDYRGYIAHKRIWKGIKGYASEQLPASEFEVTDPGNWSLEDPTQKLGIQYLTDGDIKGATRLANGKSAEFFTYCTKNGAMGSYVLVDMKQSRVAASVRLYLFFSMNDAGIYTYGPFNQNYNDRLPCDIKIYASNDANDDAGWVLLGNYYTNPNEPAANGWGNSYVGPLKTKEQMDAIDPRYCEVVFKLSEDTYRFLKVQVDDVFNTTPIFSNMNENVSYHELEVYVKKEN